MMLNLPPPIRSQYDTYANYMDIDYSYTSPLNSDGSNFPCKGYQIYNESALESYVAGQTYYVNITGETSHLGGTCQLSISYDGAKSFQVIKSMIGACPLKPIYDFTIPSYAPSATNVLFAWTWINQDGNRDFYMNCAWVNITGGPQASEQQWSRLPDIFVGQLSGINSCQIPEGTDYVPPQPGPEVEYGGGLNASSPPWPTDCGKPAKNIYVRTAGMPWNTSLTSTVTGSGLPASAASSAAASTSSNTGGITTYTTVYVEEDCSGSATVTTSANVSTGTQYPTTLSTTPSSTAAPSSSSAVASPSATSSTPAYAIGSTDMYEPCVPGTILCTSASVFLTCDEPSTSTNAASQASGWSWQLPRSVAAGMMCLPFLSPQSSAVEYFGQMPGAPDGYFRDDRYVRARPDGSCDVDGALQCNGPGDFWICDQGGWVDMGSVAEGTECVDGEIVAAS